MRQRLAPAIALCLLLIAPPAVWASAEAPAAEPGPPETGQPPAAPAELTPPAEPTPVEMSPEEKADAEIGKRADEDIRERYTVLKDSPDLPRIAAVIEHLRSATEKPHQTYQIRVIDSGAINSFAVPGGYLYFTQGLLQAIESEDELAAVAAHEMAHICLDHSRRLMSKDERYQRILGPVMLAAILAEMSRPQHLPGTTAAQRDEMERSHGIDPIAIAAVGSLVVQDALNHYGREAELEADHQAVLYLWGGPNGPPPADPAAAPSPRPIAPGQYHPVAVLTVLEGLAHLERSEPTQTDMGVFQTHPGARERAEAVLQQLAQLGIPIERRRVTKSLVAEAGRLMARPAVAGSSPDPAAGEGDLTAEGDREIGELRLNGRVVFQPAVELDGVSPAGRAELSAEVLNSLLLASLQLLEIGVVEVAEAELPLAPSSLPASAGEARGGTDRAEITARGETVLTITQADAGFHGSTVGALTEAAMRAIELGFQEERVRRAY